MKRILLLIALSLSGLAGLFSQGTCTEQLTKAQRSFDNGLLDDIPELLSDCMEDGFTKEEKANAYKLLIQTYLFSEQIKLADELMILFLSEFPSYSLAVNDPREFVDLYDTYRTDPIYKFEFLASASLTVPMVIYSPSATDHNADLNDYSPGIGVNFEANYINALVGDLNYSVGLSFSYSQFGFYNEPFEYNYLDVRFKSMSVGLPLAIRYDLDLKGLSLYAKAGIEPTYLLSYKADLTLTDRRGGDPIKGENIQFTEYHRRFDIRPFVGLGAKINLGRDQLHIAVGYKFGIVPQSPEEDRFPDFDFLGKFYFLETDMLRTTPSVSISYFRPIYNPKKLR